MTYPSPGRVRGGVCLIALASMAFAIPSSTPAEAGESTISIDPVVGHPFQRAVVTGAGFGTDETVDISFDRLAFAKVVAGPDGSFVFRRRVPRAALPGPATVAAFGESSGSRARASFIVRTNWPMLNGDPTHTGDNPFENVLSPSTVLGLHEAWTARVGTYSDESPVVVDGVVYVGADSNDHLWALDASTGAVRWTFPTGGPVDSTPAVSAGAVFVTSYFGDLFAVDAGTGAELWSHPIGNYAFSSPAVADGVVYVGGGDDESLHALDAATGAELWSFNTGSYVGSSPAVAHGVVYVGSLDHNVYAVDAETGTELWRYLTGDSVYSSPAVVDGVVYIGSDDHNVYALDAATGTELWMRATADMVNATPAVASGVVYVSSDDNNVYALDAATGSELWSVDIGWSNLPSSPTVANGVVYVGGWKGGAGLYAVDAATGAQLFRYSKPGWVGASPTVVDGRVYVSASNQTLYCLDLTGPPGGCGFH